MRLKELNDSIAAACNVRANVVSQVQTETFRALRAAMDKGEKVIVPEFGLFLVRDVPGEDGAPGKKVVRFKARSGEKKDKKDKKDKKVKKEKKGKAAGKENQTAAAAGPSSDDADED
jgi:nucleoid DNA-binding protein